MTKLGSHSSSSLEDHGSARSMRNVPHAQKLDQAGRLIRPKGGCSYYMYPCVLCRNVGGNSPPSLPTYGLVFDCDEAKVAASLYVSSSALTDLCIVVTSLTPV